MLHVFAVNQGRLMTYDVNLAMEKVASFKNVLESTCQIATRKQVLLVRDGRALEDSEKVCTYAAGTDSNPLYLFDMSAVDKPFSRSELPNLVQDFSNDVVAATNLPSGYVTLSKRTKLAIRLKEATINQVSSLKSLINEQQLMFEGWQAAFGNLDLVLDGFEQRMNAISKQCDLVFDEIGNQESVLERFDDVISCLGKISLLSSLMHGDGEVSASGATLLDWIEERCHGVKMQELVHGCIQQGALLTRDKAKQLVAEGRKAVNVARNPTVRDDSRIRDVLGAQGQLSAAAQAEVPFQTGLAQRFVKNQEVARNLDESVNHDAMMTLCESHVNQLRKMHEIESGTREAVRKCYQHKAALSHSFYKSLKWIYAVEERVASCDQEISIFHDRLMELRHKIKFLEATEKAPEVYIQFVAECARRREFGAAFVQWTDGFLTATCEAREREMEQRKKFKAIIGRHFVSKLFPGLCDKPPVVAKRPLRKFDVNLPIATQDDVTHIVNALPHLKEFQNKPLIGQFPWKLVCSSKTTISFHGTIEPIVTSQSIASSECSVTSGTKQSLPRLAEGFIINPADHNMPRSPPDDADEFFSLSSPPHAFVPISPLEPCLQLSSPILPTPSKRGTSQSHCSSDDDLFLSINNDVTNNENKLRKLEEKLKLKEKDLAQLKKKCSDVTLHLEQAQTASLDLIGQLEKGKEERRKAWEKEEKATRKTEELEERIKKLTEENRQLHLRVTVGGQEMKELREELMKQKEEFTMKSASSNEESEREKWEMETRFKEDREKFLKTIANLERNISHRSDELATAEDHIQELEKQLSDAEASLATMKVTKETCTAEMEICQNDVTMYKEKYGNMESKLNEMESRVVAAEESERKAEERMLELRTMLAGYEVELEGSEVAAKELNQQRLLVQELNLEGEKLRETNACTLEELREKEMEVLELEKQLECYKSKVEENEVEVQRKMETFQSNCDKMILNAKEEGEERLKKMFESNKKKIEDVVRSHQDELERLKEEHYWKLEELKKEQSNVMDELRADNLNDLCRARGELLAMEEEMKGLKDRHQKEVDDLTGQYNEKIESMRQELDTSVLFASSAPMTSSNGESTSKMARMDEAVTTSEKDHVDALKSSFKKREEAATKRRQVMFNSAIQRLTAVKDAEIELLKKQLFNQPMTSSVTYVAPDSSLTSSMQLNERRKVAVCNFQVEDAVLVTFDPKHSFFVIFTTSHTLHFLHYDSMKQLGLKDADRRSDFFVLTRFLSKQYCQAKKDTNRFKVPVGTKFYRVKVQPFIKDPTTT